MHISFITYVEFLFSPAVQFLFGILNFNFLFGPGHPAYDRTKLYSIFMYAYLHKDFYHYGCGLFYVVRINVLRCFTNGSTPSPNCLDDFLRNSNRVVMKAIFICTLVELNDLGKVEFKRIYIDSTDGKINGSVNYKIEFIGFKVFEAHA